MLIRFFIVTVLSFSLSSAFAQIDKEYITIGAGYDLLSFKGDLNQEQKLTSLNNFRAAYTIFIEKRFLGLVGISANAMFGKVSQYENSYKQNLYFQSKVQQFDARVSLYFDNEHLLGEQTLFTPFLSAGIGYLTFDPYGDLQDKYGNTYYYWTDGSIRDMSESTQNEAISKHLSRDYTYDTQLTNPTVNYKRSTYVIPLTIGVNGKLASKLYARVAATYTLTGSDYIDNTSNDNKKDRIISTNFSMTYTIGKNANENKHYKNTDFKSLIEGDHDNDGVKDIDDICQGTPSGVKIDLLGCPLDSDKDGIADYLDKEENTVKDAHVNEFGVTISDEEFLQRFMHRDSTGIKNTIFNVHHVTNMEELKGLDKKIDKHSKKHKHVSIPSKYVFADFDHDGVIHSREAFTALDRFLNGELDISIEQLYGMIDFYFEQ